MMQTVVASIASDPNVWDAVMQNKALVGLLQSEKASKIIILFPFYIVLFFLTIVISTNLHFFFFLLND